MLDENEVPIRKIKLSEKYTISTKIFGGIFCVSIFISWFDTFMSCDRCSASNFLLFVFVVAAIFWGMASVFSSGGINYIDIYNNGISVNDDFFSGSSEINIVKSEQGVGKKATVYKVYLCTSDNKILIHEAVVVFFGERLVLKMLIRKLDKIFRGINVPIKEIYN